MFKESHAFLLDCVVLFVVLTNKPESRSHGYSLPREVSCPNLNLEELCVSNCRNVTKLNQIKMVNLYTFIHFLYHLLTGQCLLAYLTHFSEKTACFCYKWEIFIFEDLI